MKKTELIKIMDKIKVADVADDEKVSTKAVYQWIHAGRISPVYTVGDNPVLYLIGKNYKVIR